jgi:MFS family permease
MDHAGAVVGPALASLFLFFYPGQYRTLFALTIIPGAIAVILIFFVHEQRTTAVRTPNEERSDARTPNEQRLDARTSNEETSVRTTHVPLPRDFTLFMLVLTLFTLGNSTDAFLLLKLTDAAGSAQFIPLMWAGLHVVKSATSIIGGSWSDRIGRRTVIAMGWLVYAVVYAGFALSGTLAALFSWFLLYGFYFGFSEGTEKALVADLAPAERRGLAFGVYNAVQGLGSLAASVVFGFVWTAYGSAAAFAMGAALALLSTALLFTVGNLKSEII